MLDLASLPFTCAQVDLKLSLGASNPLAATAVPDAALAQWQDLVVRMGWNDESKLVHLEGFLISSGLMPVFMAYARQAADEEIASAAELGADEADHDPEQAFQTVAEHVHELGKKYGFRQDADSVGIAVDESADLLSIDLDERARTSACDEVLRIQRDADAKEMGEGIDDDPVEVSAPGQVTAAGQLVLSVNLADVLGDYEDAEALPEWAWLQARASYITWPSDGPTELVLNLARSFDGVPSRLISLLSQARGLGMAYLLIHHGT